MARKIIQLYRGTTAQNDAFTGAAGEVTVDTDVNGLRVHDGSTVGGHAIYTKSQTDTLLSAKANDNAVVHLAGSETITGAKQFKGDSSVMVGVANTNDDFTTTPSSDVPATIGVTDKNGKWVGGWEHYHLADGAYIKQMSVRQQNGSNYATLGVRINSQGAKRGFAPTVASATDNADNIATTAWVYNNRATWTTNCITEIPQDINLTLSSGTLTLKAGSKVYVPNGFEQDGTTPHFDVITIANDVSGTISFNGTCTVVYRPSNNIISFYSSTVDSSGSTDPSGTATFYNTTQNIMKRFDGSSLTTSGFSFPIARVVTTTSGVQSIVEVSNGFGYIGSTIFALPGVKGLIPNDRNSGGTLKSTAFTLSSVVTTTLSDTAIRTVGVRANVMGSSTAYVYDETNNQNLNNGSFWNVCAFAVVKAESGKITSFSTKTAFHAVDYNDFQPVANFVNNYALGVPDWANKTQITSPFTATENGYVVVWQTGGDLRGTLSINGQQVDGGNTAHAGSSGGNMAVAVGDVVTVNAGALYFIPCKK